MAYVKNVGILIFIYLPLHIFVSTLLSVLLPICL